MRVVIVPGFGGAEDEHWQSAWQRELGNQAVRIQPRSWTEPEVADWHGALSRAATADNILVAHSLGCLAAASWLQQSREPPVRGAFLVAAPDPRSASFPAECVGFHVPPGPLGVPTLVIASSDDPYSSSQCSRVTASQWNAALVEIPGIGHVNVKSGVGRWDEGRRLLTAFVAGLDATS